MGLPEKRPERGPFDPTTVLLGEGRIAVIWFPKGMTRREWRRVRKLVEAYEEISPEEQDDDE